MGDWLARIRFPDGHELYAIDSSHWSMVMDEIYDSYRPAGSRDDGGFVRDRNFIQYGTPPLPRYPDRPLSEPDDLIVVRITEECGMFTWTALFCPRRNMLVGPRRPFVGIDIQRNFDLLEQNGKLHLKERKTTSTQCGQEATGKVLPFHYVRVLHIVDPDPPPPDRNLFEEWNDGAVCRHCLLKALLTWKEWSW